MCSVIRLEVKGLIKIIEVQGSKNFVHGSITKHPRGMDGWNINYENNCAHLKMKGSLHSAIQFGL